MPTDPIEALAMVLPQAIASVHGCLPEDCANVSDMSPGDWRRVAEMVWPLKDAVAFMYCDSDGSKFMMHPSNVTIVLRDEAA